MKNAFFELDKRRFSRGLVVLGICFGSLSCVTDDCIVIREYRPVQREYFLRPQKRYYPAPRSYYPREHYHHRRSAPRFPSQFHEFPPRNPHIQRFRQ